MVEWLTLSCRVRRCMCNQFDNLISEMHYWTHRTDGLVPLALLSLAYGHESLRGFGVFSLLASFAIERPLAAVLQLDSPRSVATLYPPWPTQRLAKAPLSRIYFTSPSEIPKTQKPNGIKLP
jgi:hypothetical protein